MTALHLPPCTDGPLESLSQICVFQGPPRPLVGELQEGWDSVFCLHTCSNSQSNALHLLLCTTLRGRYILFSFYDEKTGPDGK